MKIMVLGNHYYAKTSVVDNRELSPVQDYYLYGIRIPQTEIRKATRPTGVSEETMEMILRDFKSIENSTL
jgi:hypothetical protein